MPTARMVPISRIRSYMVMRKVFRMPTMMMRKRTSRTPSETPFRTLTICLTEESMSFSVVTL